MEAHAVGIDDLHLADFLLQDVEFVAQKAKLDVLGGEGIAIVELEPFAQLELVDQLVGTDRPRLRLGLSIFPGIGFTSAS